MEGPGFSREMGSLKGRIKLEFQISQYSVWKSKVHWIDQEQNQDTRRVEIISLEQHERFFLKMQTISGLVFRTK